MYAIRRCSIEETTVLVKPGILESLPDKPWKMNMYEKKKKKVICNKELEACNMIFWLLRSKAGKYQKAVINSLQHWRRDKNWSQVWGLAVDEAILPAHHVWCHVLNVLFSQRRLRGVLIYLNQILIHHSWTATWGCKSQWADELGLFPRNFPPASIGGMDQPLYNPSDDF